MKWIHKLLKCFSFSAVLFTFQACYGTLEDGLECDYEFAVQVVDGEGNGIPNVEVRTSNVANPDQYFFSDTTQVSGMAFIKGVVNGDADRFKIEVNPLENIEFQAKDTIIAYSEIDDIITITLNRK